MACTKRWYSRAESKHARDHSSQHRRVHAKPTSTSPQLPCLLRQRHVSDHVAQIYRSAGKWLFPSCCDWSDVAPISLWHHPLARGHWFSPAPSGAAPPSIHPTRFQFPREDSSGASLGRRTMTRSRRTQVNRPSLVFSESRRSNSSWWTRPSRAGKLRL